MRGLFNKSLGASLCAPFVLKFLGGEEAMGAAINMFGNLLQMSNTNSQNTAAREYDWMKTNDLMFFSDEQAEKARQHQSELLKNQQDWNERYYQLYNSPSAMRKQLESAGYHPYLAADSQPNVGVVPSTSASSSPAASAPSTGNPPMLPVNANFLGTAVDSYLRAKSVNAEVANQQQKTIQDALKNAFDLYKLTGSKEDANQLLRLAVSSSAGINADAPEFRILDISIGRMEIQRQFEQLQYDIEQEFGRTERADKVMNMEMNFTRIAAEIGRMSVQNRLDEATIQRVASEIARNFAAAGLDSSNAELLNRSMNYLISRAKNEASSSYYSALTAKGEYGIKAGVYSAASSEVGQFVEQFDYYADKIVDKAGKLMKFNFSTGKFDSNVNGTYSTESKNKNWNIRSSWDPVNGYNVPNKGVGSIDAHVRP